MHRTKFILFVLASNLLVACSDDTEKLQLAARSEGELIPRSMQEKASYYLISVAPDGDHLKTISSRISTLSRGYSVTRIDCNKKRYQDLGYGENKQSNIKMYDGVKWTNLVTGSSKHDLVTYVCK